MLHQHVSLISLYAVHKRWQNNCSPHTSKSPNLPVWQVNETLLCAPTTKQLNGSREIRCCLWILIRCNEGPLSLILIFQSAKLKEHQLITSQSLADILHPLIFFRRQDGQSHYSLHLTFQFLILRRLTIGILAAARAFRWSICKQSPTWWMKHDLLLLWKRFLIYFVGKQTFFLITNRWPWFCLRARCLVQGTRLLQMYHTI